jgi:hypothetical protein
MVTTNERIVSTSICPIQVSLLHILFIMVEISLQAVSTPICPIVLISIYFGGRSSTGYWIHVESSVRPLHVTQLKFEAFKKSFVSTKITVISLRAKSYKSFSFHSSGKNNASHRIHIAVQAEELLRVTLTYNNYQF